MALRKGRWAPRRWSAQNGIGAYRRGARLGRVGMLCGTEGRILLAVSLVAVLRLRCLLSKERPLVLRSILGASGCPFGGFGMKSGVRVDKGMLHRRGEFKHEEKRHAGRQCARSNGRCTWREGGRLSANGADSGQLQRFSEVVGSDQLALRVFRRVKQIEGEDPNHRGLTRPKDPAKIAAGFDKLARLMRCDLFQINE